MGERTYFEHALDLTISVEQAAADFYTRMAEQAGAPYLREIFQGFAKEEKAHKAKLEFIKSIGEMEPLAGQLMDLNPADFPEAVPPSPDLSVRQALIWAMRKEKSAFKFFCAFAALAPNDSLRAVFSALAFEEANHKLRFEIACDDLEKSGLEN
jgi:rubrerythrin